MKLRTLFLALVLCTPSLRAAEVVLDLSGAQIAPGKEIRLNSGFQRLPASSAYEFEFDGTVKGTGLAASLVPPGTSIQDFVEANLPGETFDTAGTVSNPGGRLPFGVIKRKFSVPVPVPQIGTTVNVKFKLNAGVAADGRVYFEFTGFDFGIPGIPISAGIEFEPGSKFTMRSLFEQFAGVYAGHVAGAPFSIGTQGFARVAVSLGGLITGQIQVAGRVQRIKTGLNQNTETPEIALGATGLRVQFSADDAQPGVVSLLLRGQAGIIGTIMLKRGAHLDGPPTPRSGAYTALLIPPSLDSGETPSIAPVAPGFLRVKISAAGNVIYTGQLCDGTKIAGGSLVTAGDVFGLFVSLTSGFGGLFGDLTLLPETDISDLGGSLRWVKPGLITQKVFPLSLDKTLEVQGSRYIAPEPGQRALAMNRATVSLSAGNLAAPANIGVLLSAQNKIISPAALVLALKAPSGVLHGTYKPVGGRTVKLLGVILQKQNRGGGSFIGKPGTGVPVEAGAISVTAGP